MKAPKTPLICAPLVAPTATLLLREARMVLAKKPDILEWRVDHFRDVADTDAVLEAARKLRRQLGRTRLIFTHRSAREGGSAKGLRAAGVVRLYAAIGAERLADFVDFEMRNTPRLVRQVVDTAHRQRVRVILSFHDFKRTPPVKAMRDRFVQAERLGADMAKVAVMPRDRDDVLALLLATAQAKEKARIPLVSMSMGPMGAITRVMGGLFGSTMTFAVGERSSAPGQIPIADLRAAFELLGPHFGRR